METKQITTTSFDEAKYYLGNICKKGHTWRDTDLSLRAYCDRGCVDCKRIRSQKSRRANPEKNRQRLRDYYRSERGRQQREKYSKSETRKESQHKWNNSERGRRIKEEWSKSEKGRNYYSGEKYRSIKRNKDRQYAQTSTGKLVHLKAQRRYRSVNRDNLSIKTTLYRQTPQGKEVHRATQQRRIARKKQNHVGLYSLAEIEVLRVNFDGLCAYCRKKSSTEIDHFIPVSLGGADALGNLIPCCRACNSSKSNLPPDAWFKSQLFYSKTKWSKILKVLGKTEENLWQVPLI